MELFHGDGALASGFEDLYSSGTGEQIVNAVNRHVPKGTAPRTKFEANLGMLFTSDKMT